MKDESTPGLQGNAEMKMNGTYKIFGSEMSPYSIKVRSYFRFKQIPHRWIPRREESEEEYKSYARLPIVPLVVTPTDESLQDSTPIMEALDEVFPEPSIHPDDPALRFLSALIEEFGDEWGNKLMFHHRWYEEVDQIASARTLARLNLPRGSATEVAALAHFVRERMSGRGHFVGSSDANAPLITAYYFELLDLLDTHLTDRNYLFGARPSFGDFGLAAQLYEASIDPTCGAGIRARGPAALDWCHRMLEPKIDGEFETWETLSPTLAQLIAYIGKYFLPWTVANAKAVEAGVNEFSVKLGDDIYIQPPQKYHAKSLAVLKRKFASVRDDETLKSILDAGGCTTYLA